MDTRKARDLLAGIDPGEIITAEWLSSITRAVNQNTRAIRKPRIKDSVRDGDGVNIYGEPCYHKPFREPFIDNKRVRELLAPIKAGQAITAEWLNKLTRAVNENTRAARRPVVGRSVRDGDANRIHRTTTKDPAPGDSRLTRRYLRGIEKGEAITADWLTGITSAVNANTRAMKRPGMKKSVRDGDALNGSVCPDEGAAYDFLAVFEPVDFVSLGAFVMDVSMDVDWGDGNFITYPSGFGLSTPTGTVTVRSENSPTEFRVSTNNWTSADLQKTDTLTTLRNAFANKSVFLSISIDNTVNVTDFENSFLNCSGLTSFPAIDTSAGTDFANAWEGCTGLTSFPLLDFTSATIFEDTWRDCTGLTSFPLIVPSLVTTMLNCWRGCSGLTSFPAINASSCTTFEFAWVDCSGLTSFSLVDTSAANNFRWAWGNCSGLTSFPLLNSSLVTNFQSCWQGCSGLTSFPAIDTSAGTDLNSAWASCSGLTSFPTLDFSAGTDFSSTFTNCTSLISLGNIATEAGTDFGTMFSGCSSLETIGAIDTTNTVFSNPNMFFACSNLTSPNSSEQTLLESASGYDFN